jgi:RNA polymerase sigma-70 factor (ECF subfamily)
VHNHHSAEDVAQDAVVHGLKRLSNLRDHSQVTAWMKRIAVNLARRSLLKGRKEPTGNSEAYEGVTADLPDQRFETPELKAQREEEAIRVRHAVRALPKHLRQTMNILVVDGKLQSEAATELGIPVGTVKRRAFQARALLKQWLSGMEK